LNSPSELSRRPRSQQKDILSFSAAGGYLGRPSSSRAGALGFERHYRGQERVHPVVESWTDPLQLRATRVTFAGQPIPREPDSYQMSQSAALLVLVSAFLHAAWNGVIKRDEDSRSAGVAVLCVAVLLAVAVVPFANRTAFPTPFGLRWAIGAGLLEGAYFVALGLALAGGPLGPVYTVARGGAMLVTWPVTILLLRESFALSAKIGAIFIGLGLALTAWRPKERASSASLFWAAACAVCIGGYHLCYKLALEARAEPCALFAVALACALPINLACVGRGGWVRGLRALRRSPIWIVFGGVACTSSFLALLGALESAGVGIVLTLRNTSVIFAQGIAILSGERPTTRSMCGAILVTGGAILLSR